MIKAFSVSIGQLVDPAFRNVLLRALMLSVIVFVCLTGVVWFVLTETTFFNFWLFEMIADVLGGIGVVFVTWLLFPAVASFFVTLFLEDIVDAVENRYYPNDSQARPVMLSTMVIVSLRFTAVTLALNILVLPFYLLTIWFPPLAMGVFYSLNGYLLGREYYELVALGRLDPTNTAVIRKANRWPLFFAGVGITFLFTIPILNLLAPVIGVAAITHIFKTFGTVEEV
jgi:uncharacterized protein involved in cysteine biosynthesis